MKCEYCNITIGEDEHHDACPAVYIYWQQLGFEDGQKGKYNGFGAGEYKPVYDLGFEMGETT
jgi:hypothetical protein